MQPDTKYLLFDEIQNVEGWELFINRLQRQKYKILITGSNSRLLSSELSSHLTGRHLSVELFPFSFVELLKLKKIDFPKPDSVLTTLQRAELIQLFTSYCHQGGIPQAIQLTPQRIAVQYLRELFDKIITRDIVQRRKIKNIKAIRELALVGLSLFGSQFTYQSLRKACGLRSVSMAQNYIGHLQEFYLLQILEPYSAKLKKRVSLPKKMYAIDTGLIDAIFPKMTIDCGRKMENIVFIELKRRNCEIYYLRGDSYEIDFAIKNGNRFVEFIQVCWDLSDAKTEKREFSALEKAATAYGVDKLTIITEMHEAKEAFGKQTIEIVPCWKWLLSCGG